jgi:hypothetical protein
MGKGFRRVALLLTVALVVMAVPLPLQAAGSFTDLENHWVKEKVEDLVAAGVISPGEKFRPRDPVSRADFVKMLVTAAGLSQAVSFPPTFSDVRQDAWFYNYVETAAHHGIVQGDDSGRFRPYEGLTREQMATMVIRAFNDQSTADPSVLNRFKDGDRVSAWAKDNVARAVARGFLSGTDTGFLFPTQAATRDQAAAVAWQVLQKRGELLPPTTSPPATSPGNLTATVTVQAADRLLVTFSAPVDKTGAASLERYSLVPATGLQVPVALRAVVVAPDAKSVEITCSELTSGTRYILSMLQLADASGVKQTLSLPFTVPNLSTLPSPGASPSPNIQVLGPTRLKVTFDRDINPASFQAGPEGNFTLVWAGTVFSPGVVREATLVSAREIALTVPTLEAGRDYTLSIRDLRDTYGQKLSSSPLSYDFHVQSDSQAPVLQSVVSTGPGTIEFTFNEDLDAAVAEDSANYRLRETGAVPVSVVAHGNKVVLVMPTQLTVGTSYTVDIGALSDLWGNRAAAQSRSFTVQADTYAPRALEAKAVGSTAVEVRFSENLLTTGSFGLKRDGRKVDIVRSEQIRPGVVRLTAYLSTEGRYELEIFGARDLAGNQASSTTLYFTYDGTEKGEGSAFPPEVLAVKVNPGRSDQLEVSFSQRLAVSSAEKTRNYSLTAADDLSIGIDIDDATLGQDEKTVLLTLDEPLTPGVSYRYFISGVEGANDEEMIPAAGYFVVGSGSGGLVTGVLPLGERRLEVTFGQDVLGQYTTSNYGLLETKTGRILPILAVDNTGEPRRVVLQLGQDLEEDEDYTLSVGNAITDASGRPISTYNLTFRARFESVSKLRLEDAQAVDTRTFRLVFNKPVQEVKVELTGYSFDYEYYDKVVLVRSNRSFKADTSYRVEIWARDRDNPPQVLDWRRQTIEFDELTDMPEVEEVVAANSQRVKVVLNGPLDADTASDEDNYYIRVGSSSGPLLRPIKAEYDPARLWVWLHLPASYSLEDQRYYLTLDGVKDLQGNRLDPDEQYRFYGVDTVPPVVLLPYLPNQEGQPIVVRTGTTVTLSGGPGAVERDAYIRVYVDDKLVAFTRGNADGSFASVDLGSLKGRHTIRLVVTDLAGNSGERSQTYEL